MRTPGFRRWLPVLLAALALPMLLGNLGALSLRQWDEARLAVSAWEMLRSGRWLVMTYGFEPDLWSVKPPLVIWLQAGALHLFGPTEWAVRLPAAVAGLATVALLYRFAARTLGLADAGFVAGVVLLSTLGFAGEHIARTGDYDAPLSFFQLLFAVSFFRAVEVADTPAARGHAWGLAALGLALAVLTKGIAAALPLPGVAAWLLLSGRLGRVLRTPGFWLAAGAVAGVAAAWYGLRERAAPGYLAAVWTNELGGRFGAALEEHRHPWHWYLGQMNRGRFLPWVWLLPLTVPFALRHPTAVVRRAAGLAVGWAGGLLVVISAAGTKLHWYPAPAYPWLALLIALGLPGLRAWLLARWRGRWAPRILASLGGLVLTVPYTLNLTHELRRAARDTEPELVYGYGLRAVGSLPAPPTSLVVVAPAGDNSSLRFYAITYPGAVRASPLTEGQSVAPGECILACTAEAAARVRQQYPGAASRHLAAPPLAVCELFSLPPATVSGFPADHHRPTARPGNHGATAP